MNLTRQLLILLACSVAINSYSQDLTHEVEADLQKWPIPSVKEEWKLEYMPHNNANHNVYVY